MNFFEGMLNGTDFTANALKFPINGYSFQDGSARSGEVTIGIRPEHIITGELVANAPVKTTVSVELVEPMGSDTLVHASMADKTVRLRMEGNATVATGDELPVGIDPSRASLFDNATQERL